MYFVSVTRLRLRSPIFLPRFLIKNEASIRLIKTTDGFISGKELVDRKLTFWTVTLWESDKAMKFFRNNVPHKKAIQKMPNWCSEGSYAHWLQEDLIIPEWDLLHKKLLAEGKVTKVKHPSSNNAGMNYSAPVWRKVERKFKFKKKF